MGIYDRLNALGRGAAQGSTGGLVDDIYPKILSNLPFDDKTGIPREYVGGSAEGQYRDEYRADDASAASKYPTNFAAGQILGAAPAAIASSGLGAGGQVAAGTAMGGVQGYGGSEKVGSSRLMDAVKGAAVGGGLASASNLAAAAAPAAKTAWQNLSKGGPPPSLQPAVAGASVPRVAPVPPVVEQGINRAGMLPPKGLNPGRYSEIGDIPMPPPSSPRVQADAAFGSAPTEMAPPSRVPDLATAEGEANHALQKVKNRPNSIPLEAPTSLPRPAKVPDYHGMPDAEVGPLEARLRQTEANGAAKIEARMKDRNNPQQATVRPGKPKKVQAR